MMPAKNGEYAMGRGAGQWLVPIEIVSVLCRLISFPPGDSTLEDCLPSEQVSQPGPGLGVFVDPFRDHVSCTRQSLICCGDAFLHVHVTSRFGLDLKSALLEQLPGQRLQTFLSGQGSTSATLRTVRQIEIFQGGQSVGVLNLVSQLIAEIPLLFQGLQNRLPSLIQGMELIQPVADAQNDRLIQTPRRFFSIPRDKGDRGTPRQKLRSGRHLPGMNPLLCGYY